MKIRELALAMFLPALALRAAGGGFVFVTSDDLGGRKLTFEPINQYNFAEKAPFVSTYVAGSDLQAVLRDSLRRQGVEVLAKVSLDPYDSPAYFRVRVGFALALGYGLDGVYIEGYDKLTAPYREAVEQAKGDVEIINRYKELIAAAMAHDDLLIAADGRRGLTIVERFVVQETDPDTLRLELGAWIRRLEALLGLPHGPDPKPAKAIEWTPPPAIPENLKAVSVHLPCENVPLDAESKVLFSCDWRGYTITVKDVKTRCTLGLVISSFGENEHLRYDAEQDVVPPPQVAEPKGLPPPAFFPSRSLYNVVVPRFHNVGTDWRFRPHGIYCRAYPDICLSHRVERPPKDAKGPTNVVFSADWGPLYGRWPSSTPRRSDFWRVTISGPGPACDVKLRWPTGTEPLQQKFLSSVRTGEDEATFKRRTDALRAFWLYGSEDFDFAFAQPKGGVKERFFQLGDYLNDWFFWNAYCEPLCDKRPTAARYATLLWDIADMRREYLEACYRGGPFRKEPPAKKPTGAAAITAPDADADVETIELDDPE